MRVFAACKSVYVRVCLHVGVCGFVQFVCARAHVCVCLCTTLTVCLSVCLCLSLSLCVCWVCV